MATSVLIQRTRHVDGQPGIMTQTESEFCAIRSSVMAEVMLHCLHWLFPESESVSCYRCKWNLESSMIITSPRQWFLVLYNATGRAGCQEGKAGCESWRCGLDEYWLETQKLSFRKCCKRYVRNEYALSDQAANWRSLGHKVWRITLLTLRC